MRRDYDESDARVRPNRRGSRPRSKRRPAHEDAIPGTVVGVDRGRFAVSLDDGVALTAVKARELGRRGLVVGDRVALVGDTSGSEGSLARIVRREQRATELRRTADDSDPTERVVVANAHQLAIVTALADPEPNPRMIDRCLVAAFDAGMEALLVLTKGDLASADALRAAYEPLGVTVLTTTMRRDGEARTIDGLGGLREALEERATVLVGYSGVGKSTLVNALVPDADRATGVVNDVTGRGRHTSTSAVALDLPDGGRIIDTPGVRTFGLAHVETAHLLAAFEDLDEVAAGCPRGCTHAADSPDCALDDWVRASPDEDVRAARTARLTSFRRLLASRSGGSD